MAEAFGARGLPAPAIEGAKRSLGAALSIAAKAPGAIGRALADAARTAFIDGFHTGLYVGAGAALLGAVAVVLWLPARARREDLERQHADYDASRSSIAAKTAEPVGT